MSLGHVKNLDSASSFDTVQASSVLSVLLMNVVTTFLPDTVIGLSIVLHAVTIWVMGMTAKGFISPVATIVASLFIGLNI